MASLALSWEMLGVLPVSKCRDCRIYVINLASAMSQHVSSVSDSFEILILMNTSAQVRTARVDFLPC